MSKPAAPNITPAQVQAALQALHIDTPYYTARLDHEAACVVITLYGGRVRRWPLPVAAPAAPRRKSSRVERQT